MNYKESLKYINEIPWTTRTVGLHRINALLDSLGRPDKSLKFIHVAGTNGKGSVCAMLDSVLRKNGLRTGLFTSPHLLRYNERMKVDGNEISDEELAEVITAVSKAAISIEEGPSEFEVLTAAGILWFCRKKCDVVILEVGLGGEFDSTNAICSKELAVITPIGFDHTAILGNTLKEIAKAKAGIIMAGCDVVCALQNLENVKNVEYPDRTRLSAEMEVLNVISSECARKRARLHIPDTFGLKCLSSDLLGQTFCSRYYKAPLRLGLIGEYQLLNVLTVLESISVLNKKGFEITEKAVREGLETVKWDARFEVLSHNPVFILDGAHNSHGINAVVDSLLGIFGDKKITYILGVLSDKDIDGILAKLYINADKFVTLTPESKRALTGEELAERIRADGFEAINFEKPEEAVEYALKTSDLTCSLGSLYLAGDIRRCFSDNR